MRRFTQFFSRRPRRQDPLQTPIQANTFHSNPASELGTENNATVLNKINQTLFDITLETLPPELNLQIMALLKPEDLQSLVRSSPIIHQIYRNNRKKLLQINLENALGIALVDAVTVSRAASTALTAAAICIRNRKEFVLFLKQYRKQSHLKEFNTVLTENETILITRFYIGSVKPLVKRYASWALGNIVPTVHHQTLSATEEMRIVRAFYRYQLCCILFGYGSKSIAPEAWKGFQNLDILLFLRTFEPWELEEVGCICAFANAVYNKLLTKVVWDFHRDNSKFRDQERAPTPEGAIDLEYFRDGYISGLMSYGLVLLGTVSAIQDHQTLVSTMQEHLYLVSTLFFAMRFDRVINQPIQIQEREEYYSKQHQKQKHRDSLLFQGDHLSDIRQSYPPLAWTVLWGETSSTLVGYFIPQVTRDWGYVMWDVTTLEHVGGKKLLMQQWRVKWDDQDPRDLIR